LIRQNPVTLKIAKIISEIFIPPFFTSVVFTTFAFSLERSSERIWLIAVIAVTFSSILPTLYVAWLLYAGKISHRHVPDRNNRTSPYLAGIVSFLLGFIILHYFRAHAIIQSLMLASVINTLATLLVNLKWKISGHTIGAAASVAGLQMLWGWPALWSSIFILIVGWARIRLRVHTIAQVIGGALLGYFLTLIQMHFYIGLL